MYQPEVPVQTMGPHLRIRHRQFNSAPVAPREQLQDNQITIQVGLGYQGVLYMMIAENHLQALVWVCSAFASTLQCLASIANAELGRGVVFDLWR